MYTLGFTVSVPLKQFRHRDTASRAELVFDWNIPYGDFYDQICARMDLNPKDATLGYKFEVDLKRSIIQLPSNTPTVFDTMLVKTKARIARACTRAVVLEIHNLVCSILSIWPNLLMLLQAAKQTPTAPGKKAAEVITPSLTVRQTSKLKLLREKLQCAKGHRP